MNTNENRKRNLERLIRCNFKSKSEFARAINKSASHVGNWLSESTTGSRNIGEKSARQIEDQLGLEPMSLDISQADDNLFKLNPSHESRVGSFIAKAFDTFLNTVKNLGNETEKFRFSKEGLDYAEKTLNAAGYNVFPLPKNSSNLLPFSVVNGQIIFPDFLVYHERTKESFYIDIYKEKRLKIIDVNLKSKNKQVLFIAELDIYKVDALVKEHINKHYQK